MSVPFWDDSPDAWDTLFLDGTAMPGLAKITGKIGRKLQVKAPPGSGGVIVRDQGYLPGTFQLKLQVWLASQLAALVNLMPTLNPRKSKPGAHDIVHPKLQLLGVRSCYIEDITTLEESSKGIFEITFTLQEVLEPDKKSTTSTVKGGIAAQDNTPPGTNPAAAIPGTSKAIARQNSPSKSPVKPK